MTAPATIRVLIADDHPVVRNGLSALIGTLPGCEVVGEAADGEAAVRESHLMHPDVVIMDVQMPVLDGIEATRRITAALPDVAVLMLTMFEDDDTVVAAMRAGARGFLLKGAEQGEIERALRAVVSGEAIFGPGVASRVLGFLSQPVRSESAFPELTAREREVLNLIASGARNSAIAQALGLSPKTVGNHVSSIFAKLSIADRSEAIVRAREGGLGGEARQPRTTSGAGRGSQ